MNNTKKIRVLITYIESGMGHIVSARAISDALRSKYNDSFEVIEKHVLRDSDSKVLIQGTIDLLCVDENYAYVLDYKYSSKNAKSLKERYKKQLDLYALAVEKVLGVKVKEKRIINLLSGESVLID